VGGIRKFNYLKRVEKMKAPVCAPWLKSK
jgi:hypothetical protein